jgi:cell division protein FtsN
MATPKSQDAHLNDSERQHYEQAITALQKANTLQKLLIWFIAVCAAIGLVVTVRSAHDARITAERSNEGTQQVLQEIKRTSKEQDELRGKQIDTVNRHLDCIVQFFAREDRASLSISDINTCSISANDGVSGALFPPRPANGGSTQSRSTGSSGTQQQSTPVVLQPAGPVPQTPPTPPPTQPTPTAPPDPEPLPVITTPLPVCVDLLGIRVVC